MRTRIILFTILVTTLSVSADQKPAAAETGTAPKDTVKIDSLGLNVDLLQAPSSPAAALLGISSSDVQHPTDPAQFQLSLQNASNNLSQLPTSYALDFGVRRIFRDPPSFEDLMKSGCALTDAKISLATRTDASKSDTGHSSTSFALSFSLPLVRGTLTKKDSNAINLSNRYLNFYNEIFSTNIDTLKKNDTLFCNYKAQANEYSRKFGKKSDSLNTLVSDRLVILNDSVTKMTNLRPQARKYIDTLKRIADSFKVERTGFFLELDGGAALAFPTQQFLYSRFDQTGAWITTGYDCKNGFSGLLLGRYLYLKNTPYFSIKDSLGRDYLQCLDGGGRIIYSQSNYSFSLEAVHRTYLPNALNALWAVRFNATYDVGQNKSLTFTFGRNLNGTLTKDGDLLAALNLLMGFGTTVNAVQAMSK